jgi:hypothetical protein
VWQSQGKTKRLSAPFPGVARGFGASCLRRRKNVIHIYNQAKQVSRVLGVESSSNNDSPPHRHRLQTRCFRVGLGIFILLLRWRAARWLRRPRWQHELWKLEAKNAFKPLAFPRQTAQSRSKMLALGTPPRTPSYSLHHQSILNLRLRCVMPP